MKAFLKYMILFCIGGILYILIEILARGFSHYTMFIVGGICFILVGILNEITPKMPMIKQMLISAVLITMVEFLAGCIINLCFGLNVWDYSDRPFNLFGQICLRNSIYWFFLSSAGIILDDLIRHLLFDERVDV